MPRPQEPEHLVVGHVTKPHGTKGEVFVWPLTDRPDHIFAIGNDLLVGDATGGLGDDPEVVTIEQARRFKRGVLLKFEALATRDDVADLALRYLLVPTAAIEPLDEGEVFYHQLLGMNVVTSDGGELGRVREVFETKPTHLLEVVSKKGKIHLIPFSQQVVREVDARARRVLIEPPPGLLEL